MTTLATIQRKMERLEDMFTHKGPSHVDYGAFIEEEDKIMCEAARVLEACTVVENGDSFEVLDATDAQHEVLERAVEIIESHTWREGEITEIHNGTGGRKLH